MCGFAGFLSAENLNSPQEFESLLEKMNNCIAHRGPDSYGYWCDPDTGIALGHRRLSILDLSAAGSQPMHSADGRYVIVFNGEIYNHLELRAELESFVSGEKPVWRGYSDTETLLTAISTWGVKSTVERCLGMFTFSLWDKNNRTLVLARDRLGEKPLYYGWQGEGINSAFLFGSELKALKAHPVFAPEIDRNSLCSLMRYSYIPAPYSIYKNIHKLPPGSLLSITLESRDARPEMYWSAVEIAVNGANAPITASPDQLVDDFDTLLRSAVKKQMNADVPLGAFLSGGVDSSTVVALMQEQSDRPIKTFTIGFYEDGYNEAADAKAVAEHLGTEHTELYITSQQVLNIIPRLSSLYCEPFADPSQIPTVLVSELARQYVTVSLSGDGGDELFCGYNRYLLAQKLWKYLEFIPSSIRQAVVKLICSLSPIQWDKLLNPLQSILPKSLRQRNIGDKLHKSASVLASADLRELYFGLVSHWADPAAIVLGATERPFLFNSESRQLDILDGIQLMMVMDTVTYLPDDVLVKVDRAAMGVSLETRVPFLDHRVVEFAWRLPKTMKLRNGIGKWALRQVLYRYVPKELIERPKMGFSVPIDTWLRGPLKEWAEILLDEKRLRNEGYFDPVLIRAKWKEHLSGKRNWQHQLWIVLMFQAWLEVQ